MKHLIIWDLDDTLFYSDAVTIVINGNGQIVGELTTSEIKTHKLAPDESYRWCYFSRADIFKDTCMPIRSNLKAFIQHQMAAIQTNEQQVIILTARGTFDKHDVFLNTLSQYGIDTDTVNVECAGDVGMVPSQSKTLVLNRYLNTGKYNAVSIYDDNRDNLSALWKASLDSKFVKECKTYWAVNDSYLQYDLQFSRDTVS